MSFFPYYIYIYSYGAKVGHMVYAGGLGISLTMPHNRALSAMLYSSLRDRSGDRTLIYICCPR